MSKGKIQFQGHINADDNLKKGVVETFVNDILPHLETEVNSEDWITALTQHKNEIDQKFEWLKNSISQTLEDLNPQNSKIGQKFEELRISLSQTNDKIEDILTHKPLELQIKVGDKRKVDVGEAHKTFPKLLQVLSQHLNVYLVGPAGSGKTYAAKKCAEALGVPFYFTGAISNEYKLTGFKNAQGEYVRTEFREAYENGGVFLFDEIDASFPQAVLAFNAALANDFMDFPDGQVTRHKDFYCIAAANTIGQGADRQYVGRNQLDAASLDRFVFIEWEYDNNLEISLSGNADWAKYVQLVRKVVSESKIRCIISPRASIYGAQLLAAGIERNEVEDMVLWKGLDEASVKKVKEEIRYLEGVSKFEEIKTAFDKEMLFEVRSAELTEKQKAFCITLSDFLKNYDLNIVLKGHCCQDEYYRYNSISSQRAQEISEYLQQLGISSERIKIEDVYYHENDESLTGDQNRRVTIELKERHD